MKKHIISSFHLAAFASILFIGCANQIPPSGGPGDPTTPEIISTYPKNEEINFSGRSIRLEFDRYVVERTLEEAIFISPYVGQLEFDWSGTEVEITFSEKLRRNTTYVINIGTDVEDRYRNSFHMAKAYTLAFSTGPDIDRGGIEGLVFPRIAKDAISGIMIFAYRLDGLNSDTLNPATTNPDFITQTGKNGDFFLHHIPFGNYRIYAIRDEYRDLVYNQGIDEYAVQSDTVSITSTDTLLANIFMKLAKEDTTGPTLIKLTSQNRNHVIAEFSESIYPPSITLSSFTIFDTLDKKPLGVIAAFPPPSSLNSFITVTNEQDSTKIYRLLVQGVTDSVGNRMNPMANSMVFQGSTKADTLRPQLASISLKDSVHGIDLQPKITITFSDAIMKGTSLDFVNLFDNKKQPVPAKKEWISDVLISIISEKELSSLSWYTLRADLQEIRDWAGRICIDSVKSWNFETLDIEDLSSIEGIVTDANKLGSTKRLYVTATQIKVEIPKHYVTVADASGKFIFSQIAGGQYVLQVFVDRNGNGIYDAGKPFPFIYSERISRLSDELKVRARWVLEGVNVQLK